MAVPKLTNPEGHAADNSNDATIDESHQPAAPAASSEQAQSRETSSSKQPLSKSQQKKIQKRQRWENQREERKRRRKDKKHISQIRKRERKEALVAEAIAAGLDPQAVFRADKTPVQQRQEVVPVSFILDCDFEQYMRESELLSLSGQITRSYSCNRKAPYQANIFISSWKGWVRTRYETLFENAHSRWHTCHFTEGDFVTAATQATELMRNLKNKPLIESLRASDNVSSDSQPQDQAGSLPRSDLENHSVVYLTSDSPHTLDHLEPYTSYVIGGIVDKNREKGLCYKRAMERNVRTAKLPIGEFMTMATRQILTTNQVVEIMSKWLQCADWGVAFDAIIPKRKGGKLKVSETEEGAGEWSEEDDAAEADDAMPHEDLEQEDDVRMASLKEDQQCG